MIIIGLIIAIVISGISVSLAYNQEIKLATGMITSDEKPQPQRILSDPICFVVDRATSGETGSAVTMDTCFTLKQFEEMGCTKPMLEHLLRYSNLLDEELDGTWYLDGIGLPDEISQEDFDKCVDIIEENRPILNGTNQDESKRCPDGQEYNQVLFKCVISCEDDLVYNGYTDSCTTEFELKYHGFCNDEFTYDPSSHTCYSDNGSSQTPLKDPPRTAPPEPEPEIAPRYEKYLDENNELNFNLRYDKNGIIIDDLQRIFDWCDYPGEKPKHWYFDWNNQTHHIDSTNCQWEQTWDGYSQPFGKQNEN